MAAGFEDGNYTTGMGMDNAQLNRLWDIVAEQSESHSVKLPRSSCTDPFCKMSASQAWSKRFANYPPHIPRIQ